MQAKRNLDEAYCSVKMKYLNQHVCPHIVDYYGFTAVHQSVQNVHCFLEPPLLLQIHMELMACEFIRTLSGDFNLLVNIYSWFIMDTHCCFFVYKYVKLMCSASQMS